MTFPDKVCDDFKTAWAAGEIPTIESFLIGHKDEKNLELLIQLIAIDMKHRWQMTGHQNDDQKKAHRSVITGPLAEEYLRRFPGLNKELAAQVEIIKAEYQMRRWYGDRPHRDEYQRRFPDNDLIADAIASTTQRTDHEDQMEFSAYRCPHCFHQLSPTCVSSVLDPTEIVSCDACVVDYPRSHLVQLDQLNLDDLSERFIVLRRLGAGGMGVVYEAYDRVRQQRIAIKVLPIREPDLIARFKREFRLPSGLSHRNLVQLFELLSIGDRWFLTMELVDGVDLVSFLRPNGSPDYDQVCSVFAQLAEGVATLHSNGILHRDIKPSNVLVRENGEVAVLDFGLVLDLTHAGYTPRTGSNASHRSTVVGTAAYMAPEQAAGKRLTTASDWYAVGVMLYDVLTGVHPFSGPAKSIRRDKQTHDPRSPQDLNPEIPENLNHLCVQLLDRSPAQRPTSQRILSVLRGDVLAIEMVRPGIIPNRGEIFVGREQSLATLIANFDLVLAGKSRLVHIQGPSGVGKTALVSHFINNLPNRDNVIVLRGRCYERESVAYKALDELVESLVDYLVDLPVEFCKNLLPADVGILPRLFPAFLRCHPIAAISRSHSVVPDVTQLRRRAIYAFRDLLSRLTVDGPLCIHIDDLQWSDEESAMALAEIVKPLKGSRILFCLSFRSDLQDPNSCLAKLMQKFADKNVDYETMVLQPLNKGESRELAQHLLGDESTQSSSRADLVANESAGAPYFIYELAYEIARQSDSYKSIGDRGIDLDAVLWDRIVRLPLDAQRLLQVIAIASKPTKLVHIREAAAINKLDSALGQLRSGNLIRSSGQDFDDMIETFHDRIREAVITNLPSDNQLQIHSQIATTLEAGKHPDSETIAFHYSNANQKHKAARFYVKAAEQAANSLAFERAVRLYLESIELREYLQESQDELYTMLGDAQANAGRGVDAAVSYRQAANACSGERQIELERRIAYQYCISGRIDEGKQELERLLAKVGLQLPNSRASAIVRLVLGRISLQIKGLKPNPIASNRLNQFKQINDITWSAALGLSLIDPITGAVFQNRNLSSALRMNNPHRLARAYAWQAVYLSIEGTPAEKKTNRYLDLAKPFVEQADDSYTEGLYTLCSGIADYFSGRWNQSDQKCQQSIETFREQCAGVVWESVTAESFSLWSQFFLGQVSRISSRLPKLVDEARRRNDWLAEASYINFGGTMAHLCADAPDHARKALQDAMGDWSSEQFYAQHFTSLAGWSQAEIYLGDYASAWERMNREWRVMRRSKILRIEAIRIFMTHLRARCALGYGLRSTVPMRYFRFVEKQIRHLEHEPAQWARPMAFSLRGCLSRARGNDESAAASLVDAAAGFDQAQMGLFAATSRHLSGQLIGGSRGQEMVGHAQAWMADQNIVNPLKIRELFLPEPTFVGAVS